MGTRKKHEIRVSTADPMEILAQAEQESQALTTRGGNSPIRYAPACEVLRGKGYSWRMIAEWREERGVYYSTNSLADATKSCGESHEYCTWLTARANIQQQLDEV